MSTWIVGGGAIGVAAAAKARHTESAVYMVSSQSKPPLPSGITHQRTTDSPLSQPFQAGLPTGQLKTPTDAAEHLWHVLTELNTAEASGQFWNWDGTVLPW